MAEIKLFNTLQKHKEIFTPLKTGEVSMYSCGPTVYNFAHVGNLRAYYFADTLKRMFEFNGLKVNHIMNVTDIGHLTSDADDGEDKMVKAIKREGKPMTLDSLREVAQFYFERFVEDCAKLNFEKPTHFTFASEHLSWQIKMIETLMAKGFVYKTDDGLYFDISKDPEYGILGGVSSSEEHARIEKNGQKRNPEDFAVWKFAEDSSLGFPASFGVGFPGWHIECSAMSMHYLGEEFDVHTGGIDHISIHHNNEIAQSKAITGKVPARFWIHNNHITIKGDKMAKSGDNFLSLSFLEKEGISPMGVRMWYLQSRYSTRVDFSMDALKASETAWRKIKDFYLAIEVDEARVHFDYIQKFTDAINDDLDTPKALTLVWELLKDDSVPNEDKKATLLQFDTVLGLNLNQLKKETLIVPDGVLKLLDERRVARAEKDFIKADHLRKVIADFGFEVKDQGDEQIVSLL